MKVVILAGGLGTRLAEETQVKPKPMVEIGGQPILWHIMNSYAHYGLKEFIVCLGYKGSVIKDYFLNLHSHNSDLQIDLATGNVTHLRESSKDWKVALVDTGASTLTGGRIKRLENLLKNEKEFMVTYGDGVGNINITQLKKFHHSHGKIATVTAVRPPARFGNILFEEDFISEFKEKPQTGEGWINGGFFVFKNEVFKYLKDDNTILERDPLENLAKNKELLGFKHTGF